MRIVKEVKKLEARDIVLAIAVFLATLSPGFLTLYSFKPALVTGLDTIKVLLFSAALGLPLFALNVLTIAWFHKQRPVVIHDITFYASMFTILPFYAALLGAHIFQLPFRWFLSGLALVDAVVLVIAVLNLPEK